MRKEFTCNLRNEKECNRGGTEKTGKRRNALEDREEKKMNVGEEMLTKNRVSMQSEEDAKGRKKNVEERSEERGRSVTKPCEKWQKCGETIGVGGIASKMKI